MQLQCFNIFLVFFDSIFQSEICLWPRVLPVNCRDQNDYNNNTTDQSVKFHLSQNSQERELHFGALVTKTFRSQSEHQWSSNAMGAVATNFASRNQLLLCWIFQPNEVLFLSLARVLFDVYQSMLTPKASLAK